MDKHAKVILYGAAASVVGMIAWTFLEPHIMHALGRVDDATAPHAAATSSQSPAAQAAYWNNLLGRPAGLTIA